MTLEGSTHNTLLLLKLTLVSVLWFTSGFLMCFAWARIRGEAKDLDSRLNESLGEGIHTPAPTENIAINANMDESGVSEKAVEQSEILSSDPNGAEPSETKDSEVIEQEEKPIGDGPMNINVLAKLVALKEGKKMPVSIAQVKEVLKCTNEILREYNTDFYGMVRKAKQ